MRVMQGEVFDVAVDIRKSSSTFRQSVGETLAAENKNQLWIPEGFAHGHLMLSDTAEFLHKTTDYYRPVSERMIRWNDPSIEIEWPFNDEPILAKKDQDASFIANAEVFA